ncbi:MAG: hypothetical protein ACYTG7_16705 [Planctomycetota bacterium]|jgi:hypothetical protein
MPAGLFWELHQQSRIRQASRDADRAYYKAKDATYSLVDLKGKLNKTLMICEALWSFMHEKLGITEEELYERIRDIDLSDGNLDGKVRRKPHTCPKCNRVTNCRHPECLYCGEPLDPDLFEV